jgi:hypothetical protein
LIARLISHANTQVGLSDPVVQNGMAIAQEIKVTLGINIPFVPLILGLFLLFLFWNKKGNQGRKEDQEKIG